MLHQQARRRLSSVLLPLLLAAMLLSCFALSVSAEEEGDFFTVTWLNADGTVLEIDEHVPRGTRPVYDGETPVLTPTDRYHYTFSGWNIPLSAVNADVTYIATYDPHPNTHTVTFVADGKEIAVYTVEYGSSIALPEVPEKVGFSVLSPRWDHDGTSITEDTVITAVYTPDHIFWIFAVLVIWIIAVIAIVIAVKHRKSKYEPFLHD